MRKKPLVSFVMPCFNAQVWVAESIKSVLNQKQKNIELIVVNDCSTDASKDIIDYYAKIDDRVRCVDLEVNGGMSNARNVGNKLARAKIIALQDADDLSYPARAEEILKAFAKDPKMGMFYSSFTVINAHGKPTESFLAETFNINNVFNHNVTCIGHPTVAYKKKVIVENPYQNGDWSRHGCEDFRMMTELWKKGYKFGFSKKILVLYRWHTANSTQNRDMVKVAEIKKEYITNYLKGADNEEKDVVPTHECCGRELVANDTVL